VDTLSGIRHFSVQLIDLLQGETLSLVDEEIHKGDADKAASPPNEKDLGLQISVTLTVVDEEGR